MIDTCPCPLAELCWTPGCETWAAVQRAAWRARREAQEAAQGFRWVNESTFLEKRPKRQVERSCIIQASTSDFFDNMR